MQKSLSVVLWGLVIALILLTFQMSLSIINNTKLIGGLRETIEEQQDEIEIQRVLSEQQEKLLLIIIDDLDEGGGI
jgi:hypothetical protein